MKLVNLVIPTLLAMAAVACAHDRAQDAKAAEAHLTSEQAQQQSDQNRLNAGQASDNSAAAANGGQMNAGAQSEYQARQDAKAADVKNKDQQNITSAQQDAVEANAALTKERQDTLTDGKARFAKADSKAMSAKNNTAKLPADKRGIFTNDWAVYTQKKSDAKSQLDALPNVSNDNWKMAKTKLDKSLSDLEDSASNLDKMTKTGISKVLP